MIAAAQSLISRFCAVDIQTSRVFLLSRDASERVDQICMDMCGDRQMLVFQLKYLGSLINLILLLMLNATDAHYYFICSV